MPRPESTPNEFRGASKAASELGTRRGLLGRTQASGACSVSKAAVRARAPARAAPPGAARCRRRPPRRQSRAPGRRPARPRKASQYAGKRGLLPRIPGVWSYLHIGSEQLRHHELRERERERARTRTPAVPAGLPPATLSTTAKGAEAGRPLARGAPRRVGAGAAAAGLGPGALGAAAPASALPRAPLPPCARRCACSCPSAV